MSTETPQAAIDEISSAFFKSPLWFHWCGPGTHILNEDGVLARDEAARIAVEALRSLPVEDRASLLGFAEGPCLFCGCDPEYGGRGDDSTLCVDGPHAYVWVPSERSDEPQNLRSGSEGEEP